MHCALRILRPVYRAVGRCHIASGSSPLMSRYDSKVFREPITDTESLNEALNENDERNFLFIKAMKSDASPVFYRDHVVDKLVRVCMKDGRKELSRTNMLKALELVKRRQYKTWRKASKEQKANIELDPFEIARKAIRNCRPLMKLQGVTRGGTTYQVPFPIKDAEAEFRAMKSMRDVCREKAKHGDTHFENIMASELLAAYNNEGFTIQAKQELHKLCEANRAYAHYRS